MEPLEENITPYFIDSDDLDTKLPEGAVRYILNCQVGSPDGSNMGGITNKAGNIIIGFPMPDGLNICIGQKEDKKSRSIFYFVYNSEGNHEILRYFIDDNSNGFVQLIFKSILLNFQANIGGQRDGLITGVSFVDDKLMWANPAGGLFKINTAKANDTDKHVVSNIYFGGSADGTFLHNNTYVFNAQLGNVSNGYVRSIGSQQTLADLCDAYALAFNGFVPNFTFVSFGTYVQVTAQTTDTWILQALISSGTGFNQLIDQNIYSQPYVLDYIDLGKYRPMLPPSFQFKTDTSTSQNLVQQFVGQFRYRYIYDDDEPSVWSPYSGLAYTTDLALNYIEIDLNDSRLTTPISCIIKRVEIAFRYFNNPVDNFVKALDQFEYISGKCKFYNDVAANPIDQAQSTTPFHAIPLIAQSLDEIKDRLFLGGNLEGYDPVPVDAKVTVGFNEDVKVNTWTVKGRIRIINNLMKHNPSLNTIANPGGGGATNQPIHDYGHGPVFGGMGDYGGAVGLSDEWVGNLHNTFDQRIPMAGFIPYLAGTPYFTISKQANNSYTAVGGAFCGGNITMNTPLKNSNPVVFDSGAFGVAPIPYCDKNESGRQSIRHVMASNGLYSEFELKNIPPGTYYLRIASHYCSHGDSLGKGPVYDLDDANLSWQKTSASVSQVGGQHGSELKIVLDENGGVLDLTNSPYGDTLIEDLSYPLVDWNSPVSMASVGYLYDAGGSTDPKLMSEGVSMEKQKIVGTSGITDYTFYTDHNGYFYWTLYIGIFAPFVTTILTTFSSILNKTILNKTDNIFRADIGDLFRENMAPGDAKPGFDYVGRLTEYIAINLNPDVTNFCSTYVEGVITDTDTGDNLKDVTVVIGGCGRSDRTANDGSYQILVYGDVKRAANDLLTDLVLSFPYFKGIYVSGNLDLPLYINPFTVNNNNYNLQHPFILNASVLVEIIDGQSFLKIGGSYQYGLMHFDKLGRTTTPCITDDMKIRIPFYTEDLNKYDSVRWPNPNTFNHTTPKVKWQLNSQPPLWAVAAAWVRSKILNYNSDYLQWIADSVQYITGFDNSGNPLNTSFVAGNASLIMISLENLTSYNQNQLNVLVTGSSQVYPVGYQYQLGDRIRLMKNNNSTWYTTYFDAPIKEMIGLSIVIEALSEYPQIHAGTMFEIYNPISGQTTVYYYEIDEFIKILNPGSGFQSYAIKNATFKSGDTYIYKRRITVNDITDSGIGVYSINVESQSISDLYKSLASDIGRAWIEDKTLKQVLYVGGGRYSDKYISGTHVNGFSAFEPLNDFSLPAEYGLIQKFVKSLIGNSSVLVAIQQVNSISLYIEEAQIKDVQGATVIALSDGVVGSQALLEGGIGTNYPESVTEYEGRVYLFSDNTSQVARYSRDGMKAISKEAQRVNDVRILTKSLLTDPNPSYVIGGYDPVNDEYLVTAIKTQSRDDGSQERDIQETITWNENLNKFTSNYSLLSEMYSKIGGNVFVAFSQGLLWVQGINPIHNNFFGVQYDSQIKVVFVMGAKTIKSWIVAGLKGTDPWTWEAIETVPDFYSPGGQLTNILDTEFKNEEGVFWAEIRRDLNTPYKTGADALNNGNVIRSEVLHVTLKNELTTKTLLFHTFVRGLISQPTQKT